jgi:hypothetical protein
MLTRHFYFWVEFGPVFVLGIPFALSMYLEFLYNPVSKCELRFFKDYCLLICEKRRYGKLARKEYFQFNYEDTQVTQEPDFKFKGGRGDVEIGKVLKFSGKYSFEGYEYTSDGRVSGTPIREPIPSIKAEICVKDLDIDYVKEIEEHSKWRIHVK